MFFFYVLRLLFSESSTRPIFICMCIWEWKKVPFVPLLSRACQVVCKILCGTEPEVLSRWQIISPGTEVRNAGHLATRLAVGSRHTGRLAHVRSHTPVMAFTPWLCLPVACSHHERRTTRTRRITADGTPDLGPDHHCHTAPRPYATSPPQRPPHVYVGHASCWG